MLENSYRILLVDDDPDYHFFIHAAMQSLNPSLRLNSLYNGAQAMDYLLDSGIFKDEQNAKPDIIITDLNMPMFNGFELIKKIKNINSLKHIPVFVMSTSSHLNDIDVCARLGALKYYSKPITIEEYKTLLKDILLLSGYSKPTTA